MTRYLTSWLLITAFLTGACILVIELMGTRLLAPFFGSGMYTWSALITITMAALAGGYACGGYLADRYTRTVLLFNLILAAAIWTALTPIMAAHLIPGLLPQLDLRFSVLLGSLLLFFPNLFLLATVGPFVIRLLTQQTEEVGMRSGHVFATSTIGSLLGALLTGFYIMPNIAVSMTFLFCAAALLLVSAIGLIISGHKRLALSAAIALLPVLSGISSTKQDIITPAHRIIEQVSSFYGQLQVIDKNKERILLVDGIGQNYVLKDGTYRDPYISFTSALPQLHKCHRHQPQHALVVGLGAGQIPMKYEQSGIQTDVVEIDETVIRIAEKHFGFDMPAAQIHAMDGRVYLSRASGHYDYILLDAFLSDQLAWHLLSIEALALAKQRLSHTGVLAINILSTPGGDDIATIQNSLQHIFPYVQTFFYPYATGLATHILVAANHPVEWSLDAYQGNRQERQLVSAFLRLQLKQLSSQLVLKDDYNPLEVLRKDIGVQWRRSMWKYLGKEDLGWLLN